MDTDTWGLIAICLLKSRQFMSINCCVTLTEVSATSV